MSSPVDLYAILWATRACTLSSQRSIWCALVAALQWLWYSRKKCLVWTCRQYTVCILWWNGRTALQGAPLTVTSSGQYAVAMTIVGWKSQEMQGSYLYLVAVMFMSPRKFRVKQRGDLHWVLVLVYIVLIYRLNLGLTSSFIAWRLKRKRKPDPPYNLYGIWKVTFPATTISLRLPLSIWYITLANRSGMYIAWRCD